ncbi:unnamed protein product [Paramecium pentaurelia]|uniref:Transmembrane protein n=1 Tax=Paramecium pentaurelia TaxID=43138 RepID=A0A8S1S5F0_9CILI|nr:unnamed protein product [Paramecium pentaurelia]
MGSACTKFVCKDTLDSDLMSLESKMRTLNEMSKSTKFSSLKLSITYTNLTNQRVSETEIRDQDNPINKINKSKGRMKSFNFQEDHQQQFWLSQVSRVTDSPVTVKSETRRIKKKNNPQRELIQIQNLDLSFYIQRISYQLENNEEQSQRSILKSPLNKSFNSLSEHKKIKQIIAIKKNKTQSFEKKFNLNLLFYVCISIILYYFYQNSQMGSCQIQRVESDTISLKDSSSKRIQSKKSNNVNQNVQSSNIENKLEQLDQKVEDEDNLLTVYSRIKKDKRLYNFQEEESQRKISNRGDVESLKQASNQKRRLFRTSVTHSHFDESNQTSQPHNQSLQAEKDDDAKSVKSILKKNSKIKDSVSGSPETRSVRFARGTIFRTKSQRSLRHSKNKKHNRPDIKMNESINSFEHRSPNWKRHREQERMQIIKVPAIFSMNQNIGVNTKLFPYY